MPNTAAVPAALGSVSIGREYLISPGRSRFSATVAPCRDGPDVRVCGVLVRRRVQGEVGLVNATLADTRGSWGEVAAPVVGLDGRERRFILVVAIVRLARSDGRTAATFAELYVDG